MGIALGAAVAAVLAIMIAWTMRSRRAEVIRHRPDPAPAPADAERRLAGLLSSYALIPRDTGFFGPWKECTVDRVRVAFQGDADRLNIEVGDFDPDEEQLADLYLSSVRPERPKPAAPARQLDPFVGAEGRDVAQRYYLNASGAESYPQLQNRKVREALQALSDTIDEVAFYESGGFSLSCLAPTGQSVASDVKHAVAIVRALGARGTTG